MTEPYDVSSPDDAARGLRRLCDRTGREWTEQTDRNGQPSLMNPVQRTLEEKPWVTVRASPAGVVKVLLEAWTEEGKPDKSGDGVVAVSYLDAGQARAVAEELLRLSGGPDRTPPDEPAWLRDLADKVKAALSCKGDDVCWRDIYNADVAALVGADWPPGLPDEETFLGNCRHFHQCLAAGDHYETPSVDPREADALRAELESFRRAYHAEKVRADGLADQIAHEREAARVGLQAAVKAVGEYRAVAEALRAALGSVGAGAGVPAATLAGIIDEAEREAREGQGG